MGGPILYGLWASHRYISLNPRHPNKREEPPRRTSPAPYRRGYWDVAPSSHFRFNLLEQGFELVHVSLLRRPADFQPFFFIWLRNLAAVSIVAVRMFGRDRPCGNEPNILLAAANAKG